MKRQIRRKSPFEELWTKGFVTTQLRDRYRDPWAHYRDIGYSAGALGGAVAEYGRILEHTGMPEPRGVKVVYMHTVVKDEMAEQKRVDELKEKIKDIDKPYRMIHYFGLAIYLVTFILGVLGFARFIELPLKISVLLSFSSMIFLVLFVTASYEATKRRKNSIKNL